MSHLFQQVTRAAPTTRPRNCWWICSWVWAWHPAGQVARPAHQLRAPAGAGDHAGHRHAHVRIERRAGRLRLVDGQDQLQPAPARPILFSGVPFKPAASAATARQAVSGRRSAPGRRRRRGRATAGGSVPGCGARHRAGQVARPAHQLRAPGGAGDHAGHRHAHVRIERSAGRLRLVDGQDQLQHQGDADDAAAQLQVDLFLGVALGIEPARPSTSCGRQAALAITLATGTPACASSAGRGACVWSTARTSCSTRAAPTTRPRSCWWICSWAWRSASSWPGLAPAAGARRRWRSRWPPARPRAHRAQGGAPAPGRRPGPAAAGAGAANHFLWSAVQSSGLGRNCTPSGERLTASTRAAPMTRPRSSGWIFPRRGIAKGYS